MTFLTKRQQYRRDAKREIAKANAELGHAEQAHNVFTTTISQPLCTFCSFSHTETYHGLDGSDTEWWCGKDVVKVRDDFLSPYDGELGECGAFQPARGWHAHLEWFLKDFYRYLLEKVSDRSTGSLIVDVYSLRYRYGPYNSLELEEADRSTRLTTRRT